MNRTVAAVLVALAAAPASAQETVPFTPPAAPAQAAPPAAPPPQAGPPQATAPARVLTLDEALRVGLARQPQIQQAQAGVEAARGRVDQSLAPMLPQVTGTASWQRSSVAGGPAVSGFTGVTSANPHDQFSLGLTGKLVIWDFGQTPNRWRSARAAEGGQEASARGTSLAVALSIRTTYFNAVAFKALVGVARDRLANEERHYQQIKAFVEVGTRPQIDLVSEQANLANARVQLIQAENNYATARVLVEQAIGAPDLGPWEVADQTLAPIPGEEAAPEVLLNEALAARPDLSALSQQIRAQELTVSALQGGYLPSLGVSGSLSRLGPHADNLPEEDWNTQVTLSWPLFQGGLTRGQVREAKANATALDAQLETARQQVRVDVEQARLGVRAAAATLAAAKDASAAARQQLALAEGRYQTGVGSVLELSDAQLALTTALGQQVQAEFTLASARSQLLRALGRQ